MAQLYIGRPYFYCVACGYIPAGKKTTGYAGCRLDVANRTQLFTVYSYSAHACKPASGSMEMAHACRLGATYIIQAGIA